MIQSPLFLIVTADDFGMGRATSEGIVRAHLEGPVTATSVMTVTGDHLLASLPLLEKAPNLELGLHVVLTDAGEKPLAATESSGFVTREGRFYTNGQLWQRTFLGRVDRKAVYDEIAAQAVLFKKLFGRPPAYVDSHHHAHQLPIVRDALLDAIRDGIVPPITRVTIESPAIRAIGTAKIKRRAAHTIGKFAKQKFLAASVKTNDWFFGMLGEPDFDLEFPWANYLANLPSEGIVEWVVHPGLPDDSLAGRDTYTTHRVRELEAFTSASGRKLWEPLRSSLRTKTAALTE